MDKEIRILDYNIFSNELSSIEIGTYRIINTINPHSYITSKSDKTFEKALKSSDILLPDGLGIVKAANLLTGKHINKIAGADIHLHLLTRLNKINGRCFYLGASENTLKLIEIKISKEFPNISVNSYSPPYKDEFTIEDNNKMIEAINAFNPDVLFIGMTAPKQEKWVYNNQNNITSKVICSIGAVFDFYAGTVKRPSNFWIKLHLEWFIRFTKQPKKLWRRNFVSMPLFIIDVIKSKLSGN